MLNSLRRSTAAGAIAIFAVAVLAGCASQGPTQITPTPTVSPTTTPTATPSATQSNATSITYTNARFNFSFTLPISWTGYKIINTTWQGLSVATGAVVETGPLISIRHPLWTAANKRQDIPILVFTLKQWSKIISEKVHIGAAPIPPSELGRNATYVFAVPARYNYAFPTGYQEVDQILKGKPLHTS